MGHFFLIGFMGTGKSTVGRILADRTRRPFIDLDERVEDASGMKVPDLFARHGEAAFRELERSVLERAIGEKSPCVIACGGRTPCSKTNRSLMKENGVRILLHASPACLAQRLAEEKEGRPNLRAADSEWIAEELGRRTPCYEGADIQVNVEGKAPELVAEEILRLYSK